jgi:hypothetical protein
MEKDIPYVSATTRLQVTHSVFDHEIATYLFSVRTTNIYKFPKEGQIRFAGQASRSIKLAIFWAADNRNKVIF